MRPVQAPSQSDGVVLYDGVCIFCSRWVRWVIARDPKGIFRFAAVQDGPGRDLAQAIGIDPSAPQTNAVIVRGWALFKSDAALAVLSRLTGWRWTALLRVVPRPLRDWAYDRIAANRYQFFGRADVCDIPEPTELGRFLR